MQDGCISILYEEVYGSKEISDYNQLFCHLMYIKFAAASIVLFGGASYASYQYTQLQRFREEFDQIPDKKGFLYNVHQNAAYQYDKWLDSYEITTKIPDYRQFIVQFAKGKILETGVGTSRNLNYYLPGSNITAIDWSPNCLEMALMKSNPLLQVRYLLQDVENIQFPDNTFDSIVDTFGLEYYLNPEKVLSEMMRVCKKGGQILILASGKSDHDYLSLFVELKTPFYLNKMGYFPNRDWDKIIKNFNMKIIFEERKVNGSIYCYIIEKQ
ncbi:hypothetical protein pb186bvf_003514 [Paramecium bursaria]